VTSPAHRAEVWAATVLTAFGVAAAVEAARTLAFGTITRPSAGFFPLCTAAGLALVAGAVLLAAPGRATHGTEVAADGAEVAAPARQRRVRTALTLLALLAYAFTLERLGFGICTFLLVAFLFRAIEPQPWPWALGGALGTTVACHVLFRVWLGVRLPSGPWGF
jgi:hypothetical protein